MGCFGGSNVAGAGTCGGGSWIWILLLLCFCGGNNGIGGIFGGNCVGGADNDCSWLIILLLLFCCCGNNGIGGVGTGCGMCEA